MICSATAVVLTYWESRAICWFFHLSLEGSYHQERTFSRKDFFKKVPSIDSGQFSGSAAATYSLCRKNKSPTRGSPSKYDWLQLCSNFTKAIYIRLGDWSFLNGGKTKFVEVFQIDCPSELIRFGLQPNFFQNPRGLMVVRWLAILMGMGSNH